MNLDLNASVSFGTLYKFTRVFSPSNNPAPLISDPNSQANFFKQTTLPLIQDLFNGQNCLLFAYGPTGSGKTWTVQGDGEDPGLLPRAMDVIWNSVKGKESKSMLRPTRLAGVEMIPPTQRTTFSSNSTPLKKAGLHTDLLKKSVPSNDDESK
jgi:kinesin family protein 20